MGASNEGHLQATIPPEPSLESFNISEAQSSELSWDGENDPENPYNWPVSRKWALACLAAFTTFLSMMNGTIITVAHFEISERFNVTETSFPNSYWPVTTWASGGACSALFILPLAEEFGTRPVFSVDISPLPLLPRTPGCRAELCYIGSHSLFCRRLRRNLGQHGCWGRRQYLEY